MKPPVLILHAPGTNRDHEAAEACAMAGGAPRLATIDAAAADPNLLADARMLVLPGGFSYGDDLGAGQVFALALRHRLGAALEAFIAAGRPVLGICNGFQALVKAGLIPGADEAGVWSKRRPATLTHNASGQFECRWVTLAPVRNSRSLFTRGLTELIDCPVAHGEGRVVPRDADALAGLEAAGQVALRYVQADGGPAAWPANPNGSANDIAALCNPAGNVMGLMPHPEDHLRAAQHPQRLGGRLGLALFTAGVRHARQD